MEIQRSRAYLKQLFQAGKMPTDADFKVLIQSQVNATDDQLVRKQDGMNGDSLCIGAGSNKTLLSFFSTLSNAGSEWSLSLGGSQTGLSFKGKASTQPVLFLDPSGKVGIGTDQPKSSLDVRGDISATSLQLSSGLNVSGTATVNALSIPGFGTITDVESLRRILGTSSVTAPQTNSSGGAAKTVTPAVTPTYAPSTQGSSGGATAAAPPPLTAPTRTSSNVLASRDWQKVAGPFSGFQAMNVLAWVNSVDHRSICHASAVCVEGDPSTNAIVHAQSYQGRPGAKIQFRWNGPRDAYFLECRVGMELPGGTLINLKIENLLP